MYKGKHVQTKERRSGRKDRYREPAENEYISEQDNSEIAVKTKKNKSGKTKTKKSGWKKAVIIICAILIVLGSLYSAFVFSNNAFIKKWRTIYIETAMSTMTHQWLATSFIPNYIIQDVMNNAAEENQTQKDLVSKWDDVKKDDEKPKVNKDERDAFYKLYWELDQEEFESYLEKHPSVIEDGYLKIVIDNLDCSDKTLKTKFGEIIRAINVPDNIIIMQVTGDDFVGTLACVKDPEQVTLEKAAHLGAYGDLIEDFCDGQVLAINASGFYDRDGVGNGGSIVGGFVKDGVEYGSPYGGYMNYAMKKEDNRMYISSSLGDISEYKWSMQFSPALIVDGQSKVKGSYGWGMQPRSSVGQTKDGEMLFLIVDGRQIGYSIGCTVEDCANILLQHNCYQAGNNDGGSSAIMAYEGKIITKNSSKSSAGRYLPNAFVVAHPK